MFAKDNLRQKWDHAIECARGVAHAFMGTMRLLSPFGASLKKKIALGVSGLIVAFVVFNLIIMNATGWVPTKAPIPKKHEQPGATLVLTVADMLDEAAKNWQVNDLYWPTVMNDNYHDFQRGQLRMFRVVLYDLVKHLSCERNPCTEDENLRAANSAINNNEDKWMLPAFEDKLHEAATALRRYVKAKGYFNARGDNLKYLLENMSVALDGAQHELREEVLIAVGANKFADTGSLARDAHQAKHDGFRASSEVFYKTKGALYVAIPVLRALRMVECAELFEGKRAMPIVDNIILGFDVALSIQPVWVTNGYRVTPNIAALTVSLMSQSTRNLHSLYNTVLPNG